MLGTRKKYIRQMPGRLADAREIAPDEMVSCSPFHSMRAAYPTGKSLNILVNRGLRSGSGSVHLPHAGGTCRNGTGGTHQSRIDASLP